MEKLELKNEQKEEREDLKKRVKSYIIGHNYHGLYSHGHMFSRT